MSAHLSPVRAPWLLLLCSCALPQLGGSAPRVSSADEERAYRRVLDRYSGHGTVYGGKKHRFDLAMELRALAAATFESAELREARARRLAAFRAEPPPVLERRLAEERAAAAAGHAFILGVFVSDRRYDDFDHPDSVWRLAMVTLAGEAEPVSVRRLGRSTLALRALYPYLDERWVAYEVTFPRTRPDGAPLLQSEQEPLMLRVASALGTAELRVEPD